jgi:hypothetical protein
LKIKTIIFITWPVSVLLVGWLGCVVGTRIGTQLGIAQYHNERVRRFQFDLADAARSSDEHTRQVLQATANLASEMGDTGRYAVASKEFAQKIQKLQNRTVEPTRASP